MNTLCESRRLVPRGMALRTLHALWPGACSEEGGWREEMQYERRNWDCAQAAAGEGMCVGALAREEGMLLYRRVCSRVAAEGQ